MTALIPRLLIVDDESSVRDCLAEALASVSSELQAVCDLEQAFRAMDTSPFDVVVSDICMPGCSGMDLLRASQQLNWDCAIILMTGHASIEQVATSVRLHAADFLVKPFTLESLLRSLEQSYQRLLLRRRQKAERELLSSGLRERTEQLETTRQTLRNSYRAALETLVATLEAREPETYAHSFRVRAYALHLARLLNCPTESLPRLAYAALLHDIGKIAVSDSILLKPGKLTPAEFEHLKIHSIAGERIIQRMGFLSEAARIIRHHHERWDGLGYPDGLRREEIPFGSRLFGVADTLDAMTANRCYRYALTVSDARAEIARCAGTQFDPRIAKVFAEVSEETWQDLRRQADDAARAATVPELAPEATPVFAPELLELFLATAGQ